MTENRERKENEKENKEERSSKKYIFRAMCYSWLWNVNSWQSISFHFKKSFFFCVCVRVCKLCIEDHDALKKPAKSIISNFFNGVSMWNL